MSMDELLDRLSFPASNDAFEHMTQVVYGLHEFLPHMSDQRAVRILARMHGEDEESLEFQQYEAELNQIDYDSRSIVPHLVWGGMLVAVYAAFENGVERVFKFWSKRGINRQTFEDWKNGDKGNFVDLAERYSNKQLGIRLFRNRTYRERLNHLRLLRNSFAHRGSRYALLNERLKDAIKRQSYPGVELDVMDGLWIANSRSVSQYLRTCNDVTREFDQAVRKVCFDSSE